MHESIIFYRPLPPALPALLQYECTTFAQYTTPPRPSFCMPYTIHDTVKYNIV